MRKEYKRTTLRMLTLVSITVLLAACSPSAVAVTRTVAATPTPVSVETQAAISPSTTTPTPGSDETQVVISPSATAIPSPTQQMLDSEHIYLIWDDDGSPDGVMALLYFLSHPNVEVLAATVSYGEAHPAFFIQFIADMLDYLNYPDVPIAAGRDSPLEGDNAFPDFLRNPTDSFWDVPLPTSDYPLSPLSAPELIVETISTSPEPVTVFVSGSFTNIAEALRIDPTIADNIQAIECMGGAIYDPGNVGGVWDFGIDNVVAEWNIYVDPLAAYEGFASGIEIHLTPLDATNQVWTTREDQTELYALGNRTSTLVADLLDWKFAFQGSDQFTIFDLLAAVLTTDPQACAWTDMYLSVVTEQGPEQGWTYAEPTAESLSKVCLAPDEDAVRSIVLRVFAEGN